MDRRGMKPRAPIPATHREQIAQREIGHTDIAPWLSRTLTAVFLATIVVVPAIQTVHDLGQ